jgi:hypothetical protein
MRLEKGRVLIVEALFFIADRVAEVFLLGKRGGT